LSHLLIDNLNIHKKLVLNIADYFMGLAARVRKRRIQICKFLGSRIGSVVRLYDPGEN
jgi:hypothetical protein